MVKADYKKSHYFKLKEGFAELAEFLSLPEEAVWKKFEEAATKNPESFIKFVPLADKEWDDIVSDQGGKEQVLNYWKKSKTHLYILTEVNHTKPQRRVASLIIKLAKKSGHKSILDFGCGTGDNCLDYQRAGLRTTGIDVAGPSLKFAIWRSKKRKAGINFGHSLEGIKKVDCISCIEVFQHLNDPIQTAKKMKKVLKPGGHLYATFRFQGNYKPALIKNFVLESTFVDKLQEIGYEHVGKKYLWGKGNHKKFLFVFRSK